MREIDLGADVRPRTRAAPPLGDASETESNNNNNNNDNNNNNADDDASKPWTIVPTSAIAQMLDFVVDLAANGSMSRLLCNELLAEW